MRKKKRDPYHIYNLSDLILMQAHVGKGPRVEKLPPYNEYNPNKIHVARRRRAWKGHHAFPRGWTFDEEMAEPIQGWFTDKEMTTTVVKDNDTTWYINGKKVS